ncbi:DNA repair protein RadC [Desulfoluna sp.]|uniref:RadC family protein n=1 Tax=Desulfoluna sp. TaxID=2045199 RepID=UPI002639CF6E|nr:DNA repair protein RadC [Desulfoluna sp.]
MKEGIDDRQGHRQRLRERFLSGGLEGFHDYEVVELLLTLGTPRRDCKGSAREALARFGSLQAVFEADDRELMEVSGIGPSNLFGLRLIKSVAERYLEARMVQHPCILNSRELLDFLTLKIGHRRRECFFAVYLNAKNRVVASKVLFEGSLTSSAVYPREVVSAALAHKAAAVIFAHNHPSGEAEPSKEDIRVTQKLVSALRVMGITVHEHLVIGAAGHYSFAEHGYIDRFVREAEAAAPEP